MELSFYGFGLMSIIFTVFTIFSKNPMYSLIFLIASFLSTSGVFFSLGAFFAAALEVIIYSGAIMVLFVFVIMMFNFKNFTSCSTISNISFIKLVALSIIFLALVLSVFLFLSNLSDKYIYNIIISTHEVGIKLFQDYILIIELVSMLLLTSLIIVFHIGKRKDK
ncbi:MAG: NADH-quinone oxidoreductase subunit J [Buchnera aphidicola (Nurudea yanoniella)]